MHSPKRDLIHRSPERILQLNARISALTIQATTAGSNFLTCFFYFFIWQIADRDDKMKGVEKFNFFYIKKQSRLKNYLKLKHLKSGLFEGHISNGQAIALVPSFENRTIKKC